MINLGKRILKPNKFKCLKKFENWYNFWTHV